MDAAVPPETLAQMHAVIAAQGEGAVQAHDLRTRHAGNATFVEFHLVVPGEMSVDEAHRICDRIEAGLKEMVENCIVTIHVEPEHKAKRSGAVTI